ncbi:CBS domain-containing protein [Rhodohalobacter sp. SW132]|uniref:CBS domain-containing protein n=1 Tax=Rhodohalobacter sp. SW132 TaxID=2293433 RepID=UPI000E235513|nr:CBS domain-containing protein [Rhodohalobacter sp. SW132]REL24853.1 CBS domain-containing protein [Rhodohalobacter sp. SW132]
MLAKQILNNSFTPLVSTDKASSALAKMEAWQTANIPVIEPTTRKVIGQVTLDMLTDLPDESKPMSDFDLKEPIFAYENQHLFEVARQMLSKEVRFIAVVDHTESVIGIVEKKDLLEAFSKMLNISTQGSVISVDIERADYTLTKLVNIIESESAKILGLTVEQTPGSEANIRVSIKLNLQDTSAVVSSLQRHGYITTTENRDDLLQVDMSSRADELLRYLEL